MTDKKDENSSLLKGNYKLDVEIEDDDNNDDNPSIQKDRKGQVLGSLGGSMVFVDYDELTWSDEKENQEEYVPEFTDEFSKLVSKIGEIGREYHNNLILDNALSNFQYVKKKYWRLRNR